MRHSRPSFVLGAVLATAVCLAACGRADSSSSASGNGTSGSGFQQVKTDVGVTDSTITLGALTDLSGQFATYGKVLVLGDQLYIDKVNSEGGVCGRQIKLAVKDHGYDVNKAVPLYAQLKDQVLGMVHVLGSPMNTKLLPQYLQDTMSVIPVSWASRLLQNPYIVMVGATYEVEMLNGIDWLMRNKGLKAGDKVGHIYQEGEYGGAGLLGSKYAASKVGYTLIPVQIKPTDTDLTTQVTDLLSQGVKFILMTSGPKQTASVVSVLTAKNADATVLSSNPGFTNSLIDPGSPTAAAMERYFHLAASTAPYSDSSAAVSAVRQEYERAHPDGIKGFVVNFGYAQSELMVQALKAACDAHDMTRAGLHSAFATIKSFDSGGLVAKSDFSVPGGLPTRQSYVAAASTKEVGGLKTEQPLFVSDLASGYTPAG